MLTHLLAPALVFALVTPALAQPAPIALNNPEFIAQYAATSRFRLGEPVAITPTPQGDAVLFLRATGPRSFAQNLYIIDAATGTERVLLTADQILAGKDENLTPEELARRERMRSAARGIASFQLSQSGNTLLVPLSGQLYVIDITDRAAPKVREVKSSAKGFPIDPQLAPDANKLACVRDGDLYVIDFNSSAETRLTTGATDQITHATAEFVAQEEMDRLQGYWWSPDSKSIVYQRTDTSKLETFTIADPFNPGKPAQSWPYPRAGKANAEVTLFITPIDAPKPIEITWDRTAFPYLARVNWSENSPLCILVQNRTQTEHHLLRVDPATGKTSSILSEKDPAWLNIPQYKFLADGSGMFWLTDAGAKAPSDHGTLEQRLFGKDWIPIWPVREGNAELIGLWHDGSSAIVSYTNDSLENLITLVPASTKVGDPVGISMLADSKPLTRHSAAFSKKSDLWVHTTSHPDATITHDLRRAAGPSIARIKSVAEPLPFIPSLELTRVRVGDHDLNAAIIRPRDFDPKKKYPVLDAVYAGPHVQTVVASRRAYLLQQWMADQGFIVVAIDARGTPGRGRAFERATKNDLGSIPLSEHCDALIELCKKYPELDRERIGLYGWSFGGYFSALGAMRRPDIYKAGVAIAPVADWRDYDTHYTERYMGLPSDNPAGYDAASVLTYAKDLSAPLLIMHGTADDNVYIINSLRLTDALFRAGKRFEFVPLAGFTHAVNEPAALTEVWSRAARFFIEHLRDRPAQGAKTP